MGRWTDGGVNVGKSKYREAGRGSPGAVAGGADEGGLVDVAAANQTVRCMSAGCRRRGRIVMRGFTSSQHKLSHTHTHTHHVSSSISQQQGKEVGAGASLLRTLPGHDGGLFAVVGKKGDVESSGERCRCVSAGVTRDASGGSVA